MICMQWHTIESKCKSAIWQIRFYFCCNQNIFVKCKSVHHHSFIIFIMMRYTKSFLRAIFFLTNSVLDYVGEPHGIVLASFSTTRHAGRYRTAGPPLPPYMVVDNWDNSGFGKLRIRCRESIPKRRRLGYRTGPATMSGGRLDAE